MPALVLFLVLIALGLVSFGELPVTRFPNIDVPIVQVRITQAGAAPSELEVQVTKKVEDAIAGVKGIKHQASAVAEGSSITTIEFRVEVNQDRALNDVKDAVSRIRAELPRTIDEPIVTRVEIGLAVIAITLTIIAVFVPVSFMGGIAGQYFKQFGLVVAFAVFFSLLVARLITPLLAAYFLRASAPSETEGWLLRT